MVPAKLTFSQKLARAILRLVGWRVEATLPDARKYIVIGAPHTSSWDLPLTILVRNALGINLHWIAKDTAFRWPFGGLMKGLGGIPVNRRSRNNFVDQIVALLQKQADLIIAIAPEGTRSMVGYWRSGFYHMALGAGVPIAMGFLDYRRKVGGIGPSVYPTGDIQADFVAIREFYTGIIGRHPHRQGEIKLRDK
jgi:1-acyl-sn-glycerol-3-phosphate acyltransferase